jgi:hypothetical protein
MKTINTKLALSALAVAMLATPALAQQQTSHRQQPAYSSYQGLQNSAAGYPNPAVGTYPNGATRSGSVYSRESGADDNVIR